MWKKFKSNSKKWSLWDSNSSVTVQMWSASLYTTDPNYVEPHTNMCYYAKDGLVQLFFFAESSGPAPHAVTRTNCLAGSRWPCLALLSFCPSKFTSYGLFRIYWRITPHLLRCLLWYLTIFNTFHQARTSFRFHLHGWSSLESTRHLPWYTQWSVLGQLWACKQNRTVILCLEGICTAIVLYTQIVRFDKENVQTHLGSYVH